MVWSLTSRSGLERMPAQDRLVAIGARRHHVDRHARDFLDTLEIRARIRGQLVPLADADRAFLPPFEGLVDRLAARDRHRARGQDVDIAAVDLVADAKLDFREAVEHVALGHEQARDPVDLERTLERTCTDPAGAARTAGHRTEFLADGREIQADGVL